MKLHLLIQKEKINALVKTSNINIFLKEIKKINPDEDKISKYIFETGVYLKVSDSEFITNQESLIIIKTNSFNIFNQKLEFLEPDYDKFPLLKLTIDCGKQGGTMPAVLNAANEIAVYKFINKEINFLDIEKIVFREVENAKNILNPTLDEIFEVDKAIRKKLS